MSFALASSIIVSSSCLGRYRCGYYRTAIVVRTWLLYFATGTMPFGSLLGSGLPIPTITEIAFRSGWQLGTPQNSSGTRALICSTPATFPGAGPA